MRFEDIKSRIENLETIGKGWRGIVYKGKYRGDILAFKVPRDEIHKRAIKKEAEILKEVNRAGIGGRLKLVGDDFIAYKFIEGKPLKDVINEENAKELIYQLLMQARELDKMGISKDEMHRPYTNVIVDKEGKVHLIDFERAKHSKKPSNVTQLLHFVMTAGKRFFSHIESSEVIKLAKEYKRQPSDENFKKIVNYLYRNSGDF